MVRGDQEPELGFEPRTCCLQGRLGPCQPVSLRAPKSAELRFRAYYVYGVSLTGLVETQRIDTSVIHRRSSIYRSSAHHTRGSDAIAGTFPG